MGSFCRSFSWCDPNSPTFERDADRRLRDVDDLGVVDPHARVAVLHDATSVVLIRRRDGVELPVVKQILPERTDRLVALVAGRRDAVLDAVAVRHAGH